MTLTEIAQLRTVLPRPRRARPGIGALGISAWVLGACALGACVIAAGFILASAPGPAVVAMVALAALGFIVSRPTAAIALLVASFYFEGYLTGKETGLVTGSKLVGLVAVAAFALDLLRRPRPLGMAPQLWILGALSLWIVLATAGAYHRQEALVSAGRYAMFFVLFFLVLQSIKEGRNVHRLIDVVVLASGVAALLGLISYFSGAVDRASGPLENPGDFAFVLASTLPIALHRLHRAPRWPRLLAAIATPVIVACILATYSRAALVGLAAAGLWALGTGRLRPRWGAAALAGILATGAVTFLVQPELVRTTFEHKQDIAGENVNSRFALWRVALEQTGDSPLYGVGPGNYVERYVEHELAFKGLVTTTHNAYLDILAELGIPGLAAFLAFLGVSWAQLRRRSPGDVETDQLRAALAGGFVVAVVGAFFMTEQYYPPIWFLSALGAALASKSIGPTRATVPHQSVELARS